MKKMDFYYNPRSAPCRSVVMLGKALNIQLNKKKMELKNGDHMTSEFLKLNPQHTIPTLVDNGFSVWESRAILIYLAEQYGKDDSLYPKDPQKRAVINQRLYFDMGTLYKSFADYFYPQFRSKQPADPEKLKILHIALEFFDTFLKGHHYVAGDALSIADFALLSTFSTIDVCGVDIKKYENINSWYKNAQKFIPGWDENWEGCLEIKKLYLQ